MVIPSIVLPCTLMDAALFLAFYFDILLIGQAEAIANEIHEAAVFQNYKVQLHCLKNEGKEFDIKDVKCAVFICSTTGNSIITNLSKTI